MTIVSPLEISFIYIQVCLAIKKEKRLHNYCIWYLNHVKDFFPPPFCGKFSPGGGINDIKELAERLSVSPLQYPCP
jgi:hypothetical protein